MLIGESKILSALRRAAKASRADDTLIAAERGTRKTLRFSQGYIHQNFHEEEIVVWVKVACGGKIGVSSTCSLSHEAVMKAIDSAMTIARCGAKGAAPAFHTKPLTEATPRPLTHFPGTANYPLMEAVRMIRRLSEKSAERKMDLAGSFVFGEDELAVAGSKGLTQYQPFSVAGLRLVATLGKSSGFAAQTACNIEAIDTEKLIERAWNFCRMNKDPKTIPTGKYDVLLEPEAVAELLEWLGSIGFGAKQLTERTSFMAGRLGEKIMSPLVTLVDDGLDPEGLVVPFDYEGVPKQRIIVIENGIAHGIVYDSHYAKIHRTRSTGHALAYDQFEGPQTTNLFMLAGQTPYREMLKKLDRGLWVSRFHYVSGLLRTQEALMTGLTRDGTFLVKNGKVAGAVKNLRFTQSMLEGFSRVAAVSRERQMIADPGQGLSAVVAPALLIKGFTFTGQTK